MAYEYARRGACLVLVDIREDGLGRVVDKARQLGSPDAIAVQADVSNAQDCKRFIEATVDHFGRLDHLVNNAGTYKASLFVEVDHISAYPPVMDTNFWGTVFGTHYAVPHLRNSKGKIIVIASIAGWYPIPRISTYNASKAALIIYYETLRTEIGRDVGITIVTPGVINTEMIQSSSAFKVGLDAFPMESAEECAKAIVKSACRSDKYLVEPSWVRVLYLFKVFCPEIVEYFNRWVFNTRPETKMKFNGISSQPLDQKAD
ncbi:adh_short domain-containing protein [Cephalotus follicularis]|uniref:Adh_short domain-containing protein n=1 Tax=Cephalotus follicularis TaxID=3775 RepID=A0A1Q3CY70_CEPFO|nr:adh_short domain-containing protein [Cephalotus follicularis]